MQGAASLGYLGFGVKDLDAWERFATKVVGFAIGERLANGGFTLRMDDYARRIIVEPGEDNVEFFGFECADEASLDATAEGLKAGGHVVLAGGADECKARRVHKLYKFHDPSGNPFEIFCGPEKAEGLGYDPKYAPNGFVTGDQGLGHCVVSCTSREAEAKFFTDFLGFKLSDYIRCEYYGYNVDLTFMHVNSRHHTVAFGGPQAHRVHHIMVEMKSIDEVGACFDRVVKGGYTIQNTIGRHPNDRMIGFYVHTPSGFQMEIGCGGISIDNEEDWKVREFDAISEWGHHPPIAFRPRKPKE